MFVVIASYICSLLSVKCLMSVIATSYEKLNYVATFLKRDLNQTKPCSAQLIRNCRRFKYFAMFTCFKSFLHLLFSIATLAVDVLFVSGSVLV